MYIESYFLIAAIIGIVYLLYKVANIRERLNVALEIYELSQDSKELSEDGLCRIILFYANKMTKGLSRASKDKVLLEIANELRGTFINSQAKPVSFNNTIVKVEESPTERLSKVLHAKITDSDDYREINSQIKKAIEKLLPEYE